MAYLAPGWSPYNYAFNNPTNLTDPDGRFPWGAIIGAGVEYGFQVYETGNWTPTAEDWTKIGVSAAVGALSGGLSSLTRAYRAGKVIATVGNAALNVAEGAAKDAVVGKEFSAKGAILNAALGVGSSKAGDVVDNAITNQIKKAGNFGEKAGTAAQKLKGLRTNSKAARRTYNKATVKLNEAESVFDKAATNANRAATLENLGASGATSATTSDVSEIILKDEEKR